MILLLGFPINSTSDVSSTIGSPESYGSSVKITVPQPGLSAELSPALDTT